MTESWGKSTLKGCGEWKVAGRELEGKQGESGVTEAEQRSASQDRGSDQEILLSSQVRSFSLFPFQIFGFISFFFCLNLMYSLLLSVQLLNLHSECVVSLVGEGYCILWINFECQISTSLDNEGFVSHLYLNLFISHVGMGKVGIARDASVSFCPIQWNSFTSIWQNSLTSYFLHCSRSF